MYSLSRLKESFAHHNIMRLKRDGNGEAQRQKGKRQNFDENYLDLFAVPQLPCLPQSDRLPSLKVPWRPRAILAVVWGAWLQGGLQGVAVRLLNDRQQETIRPKELPNVNWMHKPSRKARALVALRTGDVFDDNVDLAVLPRGSVTAPSCRASGASSGSTATAPRRPPR